MQFSSHFNILLKQPSCASIYLYSLHHSKQHKKKKKKQSICSQIKFQSNLNCIIHPILKLSISIAYCIKMYLKIQISNSHYAVIYFHYTWTQYATNKQCKCSVSTFTVIALSVFGCHQNAVFFLYPEPRGNIITSVMYL